MSNRIVTRYASLLLAAFVFAGCSDDEPTGIDILPFEVTPVSVVVEEGATGQLTLTGIAASDVTWESTNTAKATVNATGLVTYVDSGVVAVSARSKADPTVLSSATVTLVKLTGTAVQNGVPVTVSHSGVRNSGVLYRLFVPIGKTSLTVRLTGGTGDADIYVRRQTPPTLSTGTSVANQTCASFNAANEELCTIANPVSGTWYVLVGVWDPGTGARLTMTYVP